ncbi:EAL domain-containing protein [Edwardsiella tarda]
MTQLGTERWRGYFRPLLSAGAVGMVLLLAVITVSWQASRGLSNSAHQRITLALGQIEEALGNARLASDAVLRYAGQPCDATVHAALAFQVTTVPDVRSVNLARDSTIYCSSLYGATQLKLGHDRYSEHRLTLMPNNQLTPNRSLLVFSTPGPENTSVLVGIDGYYLRNILRSLSEPTPLYLHIGDRWMDARGQVIAALPPVEGRRIVQQAPHYAVSVVTTIPVNSHWAYILDYSRGSLVLFLGLAIVFGVVTYRLAGQVNSPVAYLREALRRHQFIPYIQPVVSGQDERLVGCEILMRWQHPQLGLIPPNNFIPLAEDSGLIVAMTRDMMQQVSDYFAPRCKSLPADFHFGFNISASHFNDLSLVEECRRFLAAFQENPIQLVLELTERQRVPDGALTERIFDELRALGVQLALDDFGTGHSSLAYLQRYPFDILKIDQSFVRMIGSDALSEHIVDTVITLAKRLNMVTLAEGVESEPQLQHLRAYHLDFLQGYWFGRPSSLTDFTQHWLANAPTQAIK